MLDALMAIMSSSGVGAITGGLFGYLNRREDRKVRQSDQSFELERLKRTSELEVVSSEARAFEESQKVISKAGEAIKSAVRPVITGVLLYMTYQILESLGARVGGIESLPEKEAVALYRDINLNIISLTAMAVSWWFASRPSSIGKK